MKKYLSVFALFARWSLFSVLGALLLLEVAEALLFFPVEEGVSAVEYGFDESGMPLCFGAAAVLVTALLLRAASSEPSAHTLNRLRISRNRVFALHCLYNSLVYLLLWLTQAVIAVGLCLYAVQNNSAAGVQDFALAVYRQSFLHSLIPMAEKLLWLRNLLLAVALGMTTAYFSFCRRQGQTAYLFLVPVAAAAMFVNGLGMGGGELLQIGMCAAAICGVIYEMIAREE